MQTQPSQHRADACTPLRSVMLSAAVAESFGADLKKGIWTFKIQPHQAVQAGQNLLVPAIVAQLAIDQETHANAQALTLRRQRPTRASYTDGETYRSATFRSEGGGEIRLQNNDQKYFGVWYGSETCVDAHGESWTRPLGDHVIDDFGFFVPVPV